MLHCNGFLGIDGALADVVGELSEIELLKWLFNVELVWLKTALGEASAHVRRTTLEATVDLTTCSRVHTFHTTTSMLSKVI